ncbi:ABC transporter permease [Pseudoxanthomonas sp. JBR18]|uniref:ABC transporter permease n=1 Tax=Pseudoxanthomonas sp. JBR18 TaxID=2969308 RepID=UPI00230525B0|nr:ABC transporter permease [Pseudoxanthomonas sp. JBR18]WCE04932.1 ABC transporter permease [Pseudoxanthomonas sp. JBR18]
MNATVPNAPSTLRLYLHEARYECLRLLRTPSFALPTLIFPLMFYLLFGVLLNRANPEASRYLMASYSVFGVMGPGLFGFGVSLALDRERGLLTLKRALPVPAGAPLAAKMVMAMLFATCIGVLLMLAGRMLGGVQLSLAQMATLLAIDVLGVLPFCALGLLIGTLVSGSGAPAVVNLVYLPLALLSGLWLPLSILPPFFGQIAPLWPAWHLGQLALKVVGQDAGHPAWLHVLVLIVVTAACLGLARRRLQRA